MIARRKSRYILVESSFPANFEGLSAQRGLSEGIARAVGEAGYMNASPKVMRQVSPNAFILRVSRGKEDMAIFALSFVKHLDGREMGLYTIRTSGSIRALEALARKLYAAS